MITATHDMKTIGELLAYLYRRRPLHERWDQVERLVDRALRLSDGVDGEGEDIDRAVVRVLCSLLLVAEEVGRDVAVRGRIEAFLVAEGWSTLRTRLLFRNLESLPDEPTSPEGKVVADAWALGRLGMLGFAHAIAATAADRGRLEDCVAQMQKEQRRRLHTRPAQKIAGDGRNELRELTTRLRDALEP